MNIYSTYIEEALNILNDSEQVTENIINKTGNKNNNELYLLKGVANWAWQQHDEKAIQQLAPYKSTVIQLCHRADPQNSEPLDAIIAYMYLMDKDDEHLKQAWNAIARKMQGQFHYFELAMFYALMNQEKKSAGYYKDFKDQQQSVLDELKQLETTVLDAEFYDLLKETERQLDNDPMNVKGTTFSTDLDVMRRNGLVPF